MDVDLQNALLKCETDLNGALYRFGEDDILYTVCLGEFLEDTTMDELERAITAHSWDDAFTAVHALKGVAGNMGFVPLFHAAAETVIIIRTGQVKEVESSYLKLKKYYTDITNVIQKYYKGGRI